MPKLILRCNYLKNAPLWITSWSSMDIHSGDIADIECKWCHLV